MIRSALAAPPLDQAHPPAKKADDLHLRLGRLARDHPPAKTPEAIRKASVDQVCTCGSYCSSERPKVQATPWRAVVTHGGTRRK
ncbi:hypothetical protein Aph01nite_10710 [Acrocarpospora phusangensis]|uniref:Uncharacterized protein n=1 Tax=Acrocarpospora phusangensis TaxID=1070424 RepID=A0A919Q729_9ACTN|nr:hypothetical protein Aph01nite_10710 [Acrocarpospora phusangensis]